MPVPEQEASRLSPGAKKLDLLARGAGHWTEEAIAWLQEQRDIDSSELVERLKRLPTVD